MQWQKIMKCLGPVLLGSSLAFADGVGVDALSRDGNLTRNRQLMEISDVMLGGRGGYMNLGFYYTPSPEQLPLKSPFGEHEGFAFRQHFGGFGAGSFAPGKYVGGLLWLDRAGWDGEDFLFFPKYNDFSVQRTIITWGLTYTDEKNHFAAALGMQHQNLEHVGHVYEHERDSLLGSWAYLRYGKASLIGNFNGADWSSVHLSLDLEHRSVYEDKMVRYEGWMDYLPNIDIGYYNGGDEDNSLRVIWNQNLYRQNLYGEIAYDFLPEVEFRSAALKYYPHPSRMIGFEATCLRRGVRSGAKDLLWGGAIDLLFVRLAYNAAYDYENFFGAKGTFLVEFKVDLASLDGMIFGRGAPQASPMENSVIKEKNKDKAPESSGLSLPSASSPEPKVIEARGIRYENKGGK